jgi:hypothetical protein
MKLSILSGLAVACALAIPAAFAQTKPADPSIPHLEKRGLATQLIVDGKPFLALGAEPPTSAPSNLKYMRYMMEVQAATHQNNSAIAIGWSWIEPVKGKFDFTIPDAMIKDAKETGQRIVLVWFGSWKNGVSSFAPLWVKADQDNFPRAQIGGGRTPEALSPFGVNNWEADARAFAALMRHIRESDSSHRVILAQVENEIGTFGDSRERSPLANKAYAEAVPAELMDYLQKHKGELHPDLLKVWETAGAKTAGTWEEVFGKNAQGEEIFMAWAYARFVQHVAEAGKKEYPVPMFVNVWGTTGWGKSPRGEAIDHVLDIWRATAPMIDMSCPDAYMGGQGVANRIVELTTRYTRNGNPFFTVEAEDGAVGAAHAFYAIGQRGAIGFSGMGTDGLLEWFTRTGINLPSAMTPAGMDAPTRLLGYGGPAAPGPLPPVPAEYEAKALSQAFLTLSQIAPQILEHQTNGTIAGVALDRQRPDEQVKLGNYIINAGLPRNRGSTNVPNIVGCGLFIQLGADEYLVAGNNVSLTFTPNTPGPPIAGIGAQEAGRYDKDGKWVATHFLGGDDSVFSSEPPPGQSGSVVRLSYGEHAIQRVVLYRYR